MPSRRGRRIAFTLLLHRVARWCEREDDRARGTESRVPEEGKRADARARKGEIFLLKRPLAGESKGGKDHGDPTKLFYTIFPFPRIFDEKREERERSKRKVIILYERIARNNRMDERRVIDSSIMKVILTFTFYNMFDEYLDF